MTAWQVASIPFWISGFAFCFTGICLGLARPKEPLAQRIGEAGIAMGFGLPFLMISAWMWH